MDVHVYPFRKAGEHTKEDVIDVGSGLHDVGSIDEEDVAGLQALEDLHRRVLHHFSSNLRAQFESMDEVRRMRINADNFSRSVLADCFHCQHR